MGWCLIINQTPCQLASFDFVDIIILGYQDQPVLTLQSHSIIIVGCYCVLCNQVLLQVVSNAKKLCYLVIS